MDEEIEDKLKEIYNKDIKLNVVYININKYEISGSIKINDLERDIIRKGFTFTYEYFKDGTFDINIFYICKEINKHIISLFMEDRKNGRIK